MIMMMMVMMMLTGCVCGGQDWVVLEALDLDQFESGDGDDDNTEEDNDDDNDDNRCLWWTGLGGAGSCGSGSVCPGQPGHHLWLGTQLPCPQSTRQRRWETAQVSGFLLETDRKFKGVLMMGILCQLQTNHITGLMYWRGVHFSVTVQVIPWIC